MLSTCNYPAFVCFLHSANFGQIWTFDTLYNAYTTNTKKKIAKLKLKRSLFLNIHGSNQETRVMKYHVPLFAATVKFYSLDPY